MNEEWAEVESAFGLGNPDNGYKRLNGYIVKLKIGPKNNERRTNACDHRWAKFRTEDAICESIWCLKTKKWHNEPVTNTYIWYNKKNKITSYATYQPGKKVVYNNPYCPDIYAICAGGIHYFLTLRAAFAYDRMVGNITFPCAICGSLYWVNCNGRITIHNCQHPLNEIPNDLNLNIRKRN